MTKMQQTSNSTFILICKAHSCTRDMADFCFTLWTNPEWVSISEILRVLFEGKSLGFGVWNEWVCDSKSVVSELCILFFSNIPFFKPAIPFGSEINEIKK